MYIYTLENTTTMLSKDGFVISNITTPLIVTVEGLILYPYYVQPVEEMRPDLVVQGMYGNTNFIDEIMTLNNIIDSWSLTQGTLLWYPSVDDLDKMRREQVVQTQEEIINQLINPNSEKRIDFNRDTGEGTIPTVKPTGMKQISVDTKNNVVKITNRLK